MAKHVAWLIFDQETGAQDGFYTHKADAEAVREHIAEHHPGQWLVVSVDWRHNPECRIPDRMFWTERLGVFK